MAVAEGDMALETEYVTSGEVAKILRVSPKTVARWAKDGKLPHLVTLGGHRRFPKNAIRRLAEGLRVGEPDRS